MDCDLFMRFAKLSSFNYLYQKNAIGLFNKPMLDFCRVDDFIRGFNAVPKINSPMPPNNFSVDCLLNSSNSDTSSTTSDSPHTRVHSGNNGPDNMHAG